MSPSALPLIADHDYPAFQQRIPELVQTSYNEWVEDHKRAAAYRRSRNGFVEIPVRPAEFDMWLTENSETAHLELLWAFAEDIASRL